jgi:lysophospholipase L1-like esterase
MRRTTPAAAIGALLLAVTAVSCSSAKATVPAVASAPSAKATTDPHCPIVRRITKFRHDADPVTVGKTTAVVLGDSYAQGVSTDNNPRETTFPAPLGRRLGWTTYVNAISYTGYVNGGFCTGQQYSTRVAAVLSKHPAIVVIEGGLNDTRYTGHVEAAALALLKDFQSVKSVYLVGPTAAPALNHTALVSIDASLARAAKASHRTYISALGWRLPFDVGGLHVRRSGQPLFAGLIADAIIKAGG